MSKNGKSPIESEVRTITPEQAMELLDKHHGKNRPLSNFIVDRYAGAMERGQWALNGEPIIIDRLGNLIDGQHRLRAVVETQIPLTTLVVEGVDPAAFDSLNQGKVRTLPQYLAINGEPNANWLGSLLRVIYVWECGWEGEKGNPARFATVGDILATLERHPQSRQSVAEYIQHAALSPFRGSSGPSVFSFVHYGAWQTSGKAHKADEWLRGVMSGEDLREGDPRLTARNRLLTLRHGRNQAPRGFAGRTYLIKLLIMSWNAFLADEEVSNSAFRVFGGTAMATFTDEAKYWRARGGRPAHIQRDAAA